MITIKCAHCKKKIIKYVKIGKGIIHRCYKKRIQEYYVPFDGNELKCPNCRTTLGVEEGNHLKMIHLNFISSGTKNT